MKTTKALIERYGLQDQDFRNMWNLTTRVGSSGMPGKTMENVKATFDKYHSLTKFDAAIEGRNETLKKIESELTKSEERLSASTKAFEDQSKHIDQLVDDIQAKTKILVKSFDTSLQSSEKSSIERLREVAKNVLKDLGDTKKEGSATLKEINEDSCKEIKNEKNEAIKSITSVEEKGKDSLGIIVGQSKDILEKGREAIATAGKEALKSLSGIHTEINAVKTSV